MIRWVVIESDPPLQLHDALARPHIDPTQRARQLLLSIGDLRASVDGEIPNVSVSLSNGDGEAVPLLARPPLGAQAVVMGMSGGAAVELFRGRVADVALGDAAEITIESDVARLVGLRDTTTWPGYREARAIPRRYGTCGGEALQYDGTRTRWVWADGASMAVDAVFVGDQPSPAWTWANTLDAAGQVVTMIEFAAAVPEGSRVVARGRAAMHPVRGGLLENPGDVLWHVLAHLGQLPVPEARLRAFAQQCADLGLLVGGSIEQDRPLYEIAREICGSIGAVFSPDMLGLARAWPGFDGAPVAVVTRQAGVNIESRAAVRELVQDLTIRYAPEAGEPRGAVQYRAGAAPAGAGSEIVDAPWLSSARVAALVCARLLAQRCRPQWEIEVAGLPGVLRIGQAVDLQHPRAPVAGPQMILARTLSDAGDGLRSAVTVRARAPGATPPLLLVRNTNASEALPTATAGAAAAGSELEILILDETDQPLAGAECTLDGVVTRRADSAGRVKFPARYATPGDHVIVAVAAGRPPVTLEWTIS